MNKFRKQFISLIISLFLISSIPLNSYEVCYDGCAYEDCRLAPTISPQCAISVIAIVSTVIVLLHRTKHAHSHSHS